MHGQLTYAKLSSSSVGCCHLCLPLLRLCFSFSHTFVEGSSRVVEAMSSEHEERDRHVRSRSPARGAPSEAAPTEVKEGETGGKALLEDMVRDLKIPNQSLRRYLGKMLMYPLKRIQVGFC